MARRDGPDVGEVCRHPGIPAAQRDTLPPAIDRSAAHRHCGCVPARPSAGRSGAARHRHHRQNRPRFAAHQTRLRIILIYMMQGTARRKYRHVHPTGCPRTLTRLTLERSEPLNHDVILVPIAPVLINLTHVACAVPLACDRRGLSTGTLFMQTLTSLQESLMHEIASGCYTCHAVGAAPEHQGCSCAAAPALFCTSLAADVRAPDGPAAGGDDDRKNRVMRRHNIVGSQARPNQRKFEQTAPTTVFRISPPGRCDAPSQEDNR